MNERNKYKGFKGTGCAIVVIVVHVVVFVVILIYFAFLRPSHTVVIHNRTSHEIESATLSIHGSGERHDIFRSEIIRPHSRARGRLSTRSSHTVYANVILYLQVDGESYSLNLCGYLDMAFGSFRITITEISDDTIYVDARHREQMLISFQRWRQQREIPRN